MYDKNHYNIVISLQLIKKKKKRNESQMGSTYIRNKRLSWWVSGKESTCQHRRCRFNPWVGEIPGRRKWQLTPAFLPRKSQGPPQYSYLGNAMGTGAWWATVHGVAKESNVTQLLSNDSTRPGTHRLGTTSHITRIKLKSGLSLCFFKERHFGPNIMVIILYMVDISASSCCPFWLCEAFT